MEKNKETEFCRQPYIAPAVRPMAVKARNVLCLSIGGYTESTGDPINDSGATEEYGEENGNW